MMHLEQNVSLITPSLWRSLQTLNVSRFVVAVALLIIFSLRDNFENWVYVATIVRTVTAIYLIAAIIFVVIKHVSPYRFYLQLTTQILFDLLFVSFLYIGSGAGKSGLVILYLLPLTGAGVLAPMLLALAFVSLVSLFLLLANTYQVLQHNESGLISQAGLYGAAFFAIVYVLNRLARRLIGQETLAMQRGYELAMQQAINRTVIADMDDGVLVIDQDGKIFEANPAADNMLGVRTADFTGKNAISLTDIPVLQPIARALQEWTEEQTGGETQWSKSEGSSFVLLRHFSHDMPTIKIDEHNEPHDLVTHLKLRFVRIDENNFDQFHVSVLPCIIIFMQDVSDIENQAQQLKLASMGRLTASIAHEVRNPLSSISYASSLLGEDGRNDPQSKRLLKIIEDNVTRLNQLIEDILKLSRKAQTNLQPFLLFSQLQEIVQEFVETRGVTDQVIYLCDAGGFQVIFDPGHLREVVMNLLSNALRYASGKPKSICLEIHIGQGNRHELHIQDDGPGISPSVRSHLFEPFYTTSSQGTGLGLYMARELCLNNHAFLDYEYRSDETAMNGIESGGRFVINFSSIE